MDGKKLAFETAMTQAGAVAQSGLSPEDYQKFLHHFSSAWAAYDGAVFAEDKTTKALVDKRVSLSLTFRFRKKG